MINEYRRHEKEKINVQINFMREALNNLLTKNEGKTSSPDVIELSEKLDKLLIEYIENCNDF